MTTPPMSAGMEVSQLSGCARWTTRPSSIARWQASSGRAGGPAPPPRRPPRTPAAAAHTPPARRRRMDLHGARHRDRPHERPDAILVAGLDDHVEGVLALDDRLTVDLDAVLADVGP